MGPAAARWPKFAAAAREVGYAGVHAIRCASSSPRGAGPAAARPVGSDEDAFDRLAGIADAFLTHDRAIHIRTDDSVARSLAGRPVLLRRSRGYVPEPITLRTAFPRQVLACGSSRPASTTVSPR